MTLKELFNKNPNIIINTDIDGILTGILLVKNLGCKIVGFTNSKDSVWIADTVEDDLYKYVYTDMFVTDERALCLDQHIVAINDEHQQKIIQSGTKFSPQIDGNRIFTPNGFKYKYPFGTVQYLIAVLESEGVQITLPPLNTDVPNSAIKKGDLIHRADDAMKTSLCSKYEKNAAEWWNWLREKSGNAKSINDLIDYLNAIRDKVKPEQLKPYVEEIKKSTKTYFKENFSCKTGDGGFKDITDESGKLLDNIRKYIMSVAALWDCDNLDIPEKYNVHQGKYCRTRWLDMFEKDFVKDYTICGHRVFSYAFIYAPKGNDGNTNFSFTIDMQ